MRTQLRGLSPSTLDLVKKLVSWPTLKERWNGNRETLAILDRIGRANEPAAIRDLMSFGLVRSEEIRAKARLIIRSLFTLIPIEALQLLDESLRQSWAHLEDWYGLRPEAIDNIGLNTDSDRVFVGLVTSHRSGHVRAAALRALGADPSDLGVPFLLIRLADWVTEVQIIAENAVQEKLRPEHASAFVGCLGLVDRLTSNSRFRAEYSQWIDSLLARSDCAQALREGMKGSSCAIRRHCYRVAVQNPGLNIDEVLAQAIGDTDVLVRKWAFTTGPDLLPARRDELTSLAAKDSYGPIRRVAFDALLADSPAAFDRLLPFLFDRSAAIRRECQSVMSKTAGRSPAGVYRARIQDPGPKNLDISVVGLAETGDRTDAEVILKLLANRSARVRRSVIRALRILGAEGHEATFLNVVSTDVPSVAREAAFTLLSAWTVPADAVWARAFANTDHRIRMSVLKLLKNAGKWKQLRFYLQAAADSDPGLAERALGMLSQWLEKFNRSFVQATISDLEACVELTETARRRLPASVARQLDFILTTSAK